jgi:predicted nucleotidyltransferase
VTSPDGHRVTSLVERLSSALQTGPALRLAVLFGSRATGRERADSDVDIGILPEDGELDLGRELELAAKLSSAAGVEVDLVRLDKDDPLLGREVALHGLCLFEAAPGAFATYRAVAMSRWIDFDETMAPHRAHFLRRVASTVA